MYYGARFDGFKLKSFATKEGSDQPFHAVSEILRFLGNLFLMEQRNL